MIIGLAVTHLILGLVSLVQARDQTKTYWVHLIWVLFMLSWLTEFWWFFFSWRDLPSWSIGTFRFFLVYALVLSLGAGLLFPIRIAVEDYRAFFFDNARWFFGLLVCSQVIDIVEVYRKADLGIRAVPEYYLPSIAVLLLGLLVAMFSRNEKYHGVFAPLALVWTFGYAAAVFTLTI